MTQLHLTGPEGFLEKASRLATPLSMLIGAVIAVVIFWKVMSDHVALDYHEGTGIELRKLSEDLMETNHQADINSLKLAQVTLDVTRHEMELVKRSEAVADVRVMMSSIADLKESIAELKTGQQANLKRIEEIHAQMLALVKSLPQSKTSTLADKETSTAFRK